MMASLYQSVLLRSIMPADVPISPSCTFRSARQAGRRDPPDGARIDARIEPDVLDLAVPDEPAPGEQVLDLDIRPVRQIELPQRHLEVGRLDVVRVQVDRKSVV